MPAPPPEVPPELAALAEYTDLRPLGQGGMGQVFAGTHALMGRPVVLKVMTPAADGDEAAADRFLREIRAAASLDHPNVVKAYAAHRAGRRLVFVMEHVPGDDLAKLVAARGPLPVANACYYAYQAALGLQHAHDRGMVHRDVKPANLLLAKVHGKTVVKVADFGLAKAARERDADAGLTGTGRLMGTPHYLAPEQARDAAAADIRADVYSLGCTLYHLLAGRPPFDGGLLDVLDAHRSAAAEPLDRVRPEVPAGLAGAVARMMAKQPADRFQTPGEAAKALAAFAKPGGTAEATPVRAMPATAAARPAVSHWKPPTVFRGGAVPTDTAYLNAEDFTPDAKPPKPPRRRKGKATKVRAVWPLVGMAVAAAAVAVGGLAAVVGLRRVPPADAAASTRADEPAVAQAGEPAPAPPADGAEPLFNGRDLAGWTSTTPDQPTWGVEGGAIVGRGGPAASYLVTDRRFADFHLTGEFQLNPPPGNGGLMLRFAPPAGGGLGVGYEVELLYAPGETGGTGTLYSNAPGGRVRRLAAAPAAGTPGEWNRLEVTADGTRLAVRVNGRPVAEATDGQRVADRGRIALQAYTPDTVVRFRDLRVRELPPQPPPVFGDAAPDLPGRLRLARREFDKDDPETDARGHGPKGGRHVILGDKARGTGWNVFSLTWDPDKPGDGDYAVEAVGRAEGGAGAKWGMNLTYHSASVKEYGVFVRLSADGEAAVLPGWFGKPKPPPDPLAAPARHPAVKTGAADNRLLAVHRGNSLWVYVNGQRVHGPVPLPADLRPPLTVSLTAQDAASTAVDTLTAWTLPADAVFPTAPVAVAPPPPKPPAPAAEPARPKPWAAGDWAGTWSNSKGQSDKDSLTLRVDPDGRYAGLWSGYCPVTGRSTGDTTLELTAKHKGLNYDIRGTLRGDTLRLRYTVADNAGKQLYTGQAALKRK